MPLARRWLARRGSRVALRRTLNLLVVDNAPPCAHTPYRRRSRCAQLAGGAPGRRSARLVAVAGAESDMAPFGERATPQRIASVPQLPRVGQVRPTSDLPPTLMGTIAPMPMLRLLLLGALCLTACANEVAAVRALRRAERFGSEGMRQIDGGRLHLAERTVKIAAFSLDITEVTVAAYRRCLAAGGCVIDPTRSTAGCNLATQYVEDHPVNCVSFTEAEAYCRWRGARLPTRDEWRWAAQVRGLALRYVWGQYPRRRNHRVVLDDFEPFVCGEPLTEAHQFTKTCTVGRHDRTRDGIADLGGNVSEWVRIDPPDNPCAPDRSSCDTAAVGHSFNYPYRTTRMPGRGRWVHVEALDTVRSVATHDLSLLIGVAPQIGFRCAGPARGPA